MTTFALIEIIDLAQVRMPIWVRGEVNDLPWTIRYMIKLRGTGTGLTVGWEDENLVGNWHLSPFWDNRIFFELLEDAIMFKLMLPS